MTFLNSDANTIYIVTDTGNVKGNLLTDKQFFVSSDTGKINVPKTSGPLCDIKTDTGDIIIEIKRP